MMVSWSDLASDVLEHITSFLPVIDQQRFSVVCQNWLSVAKQKRHPPAPQYPWLVLSEDEKIKKRNFFNLSEKRVYSIDIPELYGQYICGSSYGWLFTVDKRLNGRLINPITRECYELPPYPPYGNKGDRPITLTEEPVFYSEGNRRGFTFKQMQTSIVRKAVLSHDPRKRSDFTAMILFGGFYTLAIWRPGEKVWTVINTECPFVELIPFRDFICFKGKFYGLSASNDIYAIEVSSEPKLTFIGPREFAYRSYLVEFYATLLIVFRFKKEYKKPTTNFGVYQVDLKRRKCYKRNDICGHALFVGDNSNMVIDPGMGCGCMVYTTVTCQRVVFGKVKNMMLGCITLLVRLGGVVILLMIRSLILLMQH